MRKFLLFFLFASLASAQTYTTVTATNVLVDNGSGTAVHPPAGSSLCFLGVNNLGAAITYTPSGGSPVSGTVCQTLTSGGALTGTLQVANAATASPVGLYYTITVINGGTTYLTIPIVSVSGTLFNFDNFALLGTQQALGIGFAHLACSYGARWTSTTLPAGEAGQVCNTSAQWQGYPPNPYCPAGQAYAVPQSGGQPMCQSPTLEGIGNPTGFCTEKSTYLDIGTGSANFWGCRNGSWTLFSSSSPGVTSINAAAGSFTFTGPGVSCSTTTCTFSGGTSGLTSINSQTGPAITVQSADGSVGITEPSSNVINLQVPGVGCFLGIGGLVGAYTDGSGIIKSTLCLGNGSSSFPVPSGATQLQLGIDDNKFADNTGSFTISISKNGATPSNVTVGGTVMPWSPTSNPTYSYGINDGASPVVAISGLTGGDIITVAYVSGTVNVSVGPNVDADGWLTTPPGSAAAGGATGSFSNASGYFPTRYAGSAISSSNSLALTTSGSSGAATLSGDILNVPQYQGAITLTTSGTSGPATLVSNTLNIPQYSGSGFPTGTTGGAAYYNGTAGAISSDVLIDQSSIPLQVSGSGSGKITLDGSSSGSAAISVPAAAGSTSTILLPTTDPTSGQVLTAGTPSGGSVQTSWGAGGGSGTVTDGAGTTTAGYLSSSTTTTHQIQYDTSTNDDGSGNLTAKSYTTNGTGAGVFKANAGSAPTGVAGAALYSSDSTNGYAEVNENNTGLSRVCTAANASSNTGCQPAGAGNFFLISDQVLGSPSATVTFSSISGYKHLYIEATAACAGSEAFVYVYLEANGDTASNYSSQANNYNNTTANPFQSVSQAPTGIRNVAIPCATAVANAGGQIFIEIPSYSRTTFTKTAYFLGGGILGSSINGNMFGYTSEWFWNSTAAITSLTLGTTDGTNFIAGSEFTLYGKN